MKRFVIAVALCGLLATSVLAVDIPCGGAPEPGSTEQTQTLDEPISSAAGSDSSMEATLQDVTLLALDFVLGSLSA